MFLRFKDKTAVYSEICSNVASSHAKQNGRSETKMAAQFLSNTGANADVLSEIQQPSLLMSMISNDGV